MTEKRNDTNVTEEDAQQMDLRQKSVQKESVQQEKEQDADTSLETLFGELDEILAAMDDRTVSLEDAFALYERGMKKVRQCNEKLDLVEKKMVMISQTGEEVPFA